MPISYSVTIDHNDDGDFSDSGEDITSDVIDMRWQLGMANTYDNMARPSTAQITLRNHDRSHSPEVNSLQSGKPIRIQSDDGTTTRTHFTGFISHIDVTTGENGTQVTVIHAHDLADWFADNQVRLDAQIDASADSVIEAILDSVQVRRKVLDGFMIIGRTGNNLIGTHKLFGASLTHSLETGKSVFAYLGDTWGDGISADRAIEQLSRSESGRFFINREGEAIFYNRHHTLKNTTTQATFSDDMEGLAYRYGAEVINQVEITLIPRRIGIANSTLWTTTSTQRLQPQATRRIIARFHDSNDNPSGALTVIDPLPDVDYTVNTLQDGSGYDVTDYVDVVIIERGAGSVILEIQNHLPISLYLQSLTLRGTPIEQDEPLTLMQHDQGSITDYGIRNLRLTLPALTAIDEADQRARYEVGRRKDPRGIIRALHTSTRSHPSETLALTLFDHITITETQTGHNASYVIINEAHHVDKGATRHRVSWALEPADGDVFFIIGVNDLDGSHVLAY